jgi:pyrroloquinoline quinone (PQQ) biosynthesis protein C
MSDSRVAYGVRSLQSTPQAQDQAVLLSLSDREVKLSKRAFDIYDKLADCLRTRRTLEHTAKVLGVDPETCAQYQERFAAAGLFYRAADLPATVTGKELYARFEKALDAWLAEAFSHPFWERMLSGRGSVRLFAGWLFELFHYTKNANRHMPLSCAYTQNKPIKTLRAKHYVEEWNHYHYFAKSLTALGYTRDEVARSEPLSMTLEMSNFMRQAAREDILAYSICSAVLEGTTVGEQNYDGYYQKCVQLYGMPREVITPIYDHLDLDKKYDHSNLFSDILSEAGELTAERASRVLEYGHQLAEHIWLWTDQIERYYQDDSNPVPRRAFDFTRD